MSQKCGFILAVNPNLTRQALLKSLFDISVYLIAKTVTQPTIIREAALDSIDVRALVS